ncbi:glycosyltransferase [Paraburkholderia sp. BCC1885]|uniref:glycosyltransferase n=1 Tax=Paraburkholderia sp. BCC1885 TaxID=2562669 RepID=UPI001183FC93|nr:glycosyltransferase [Paraburkholderia sp. BCC1885]
MTNDTVLVIEPNFTGHRWRYAEWAADACVEAGYRCLIVTASANAPHALAQRLAAAGNPALQIAFVDPPAPSGRRGLDSISYVRFLRFFEHIYRSINRERGVALVIVPYVDYFFYALPFLGSPFGTTPWIGITMRASFHHTQVGVRAPRRPLVNALKAALFRRALRSSGMKTLLSIDPTLRDWYTGTADQRGAALGGAAVLYLADPFPDTVAGDPAEARRRLQLESGRYLLVYGAITERKGIHELIDALAERQDPVRLLIAGEQDADTRAYLQSITSALTPPPVILDRFIPDDVERDLFSACDAVWLGYKGHYGMSGVLVQAYRFNKPVIATSDGLIGWFCRNGELGPVVDELSGAAINAALDQLFPDDTPGTAVRPLLGAPAGHLLAQNTLSQFKKTLQLAIS